ncbi:MAG TPA: PfkB family carbohydrate kinase [bacterium]|nr:PfkB family carbohydrate kinase [bacterium]
MNDALLKLLAELPGHRVAVVGDLVADLFVYAHAERVSREAPVLILEHEEDKVALGGAGNAANNVKALGGEPYIIGVIGEDKDGDLVLATLRDLGLNTDFIIRDPHLPTTTKTRIVASGLHTTYQQMLRIDRGLRHPASPETEKKLLAAIDEAAGVCEVMIASDYGYGVFSDSVLGRVSAIGQSDWMKVLVDSRHRSLQFQGAHLLTPNEPEACEACRMEIRNNEDVALAAERMRLGANADAVIITRGKQGMVLKTKGSAADFIGIYGTDEIADVTGAGDTVIATFALATAANAALPLAARLATVTAGLVVLKQGTATVTPAEVRQALENHPWLES